MDWKLGGLACVCIALLSCASDGDLDGRAGLESYAKSHKVGSSPDYWLTREGLAGHERVALVFAMANDLEFCQELAAYYMQRYPSGAIYSCEPANL